MKIFPVYSFDDKKYYSLSPQLIWEIHDHFLNLYKKESYYSSQKQEETLLSFRKVRKKKERKKFLIKLYEENIKSIDDLKILDFIEEKNQYLVDRELDEKEDDDYNLFNFDFEFIFFYIFYKFESMSIVYAYILNKEWEKSENEILSQIHEFFTIKKRVAFSKEELEKIETRKQQPKEIIKKTHSQKHDYYSKIWKEEKFEIMFHDYLIQENVIDKKLYAIFGFKDAAGVILRIKPRIKEQIIKKRVTRILFAQFLMEKYNAKIDIKAGFKIGNSDYPTEGCEDYIKAFLNENNH
jgi:hypothetical protein